MRSRNAVALSALVSIALALVAMSVLWLLNGRDDSPEPTVVSVGDNLYPQRDWLGGAPRKLNISVFTFGDRNRDGRYDTGDKPLAGIAVRRTRPDGSTRIERSNINGYANFSMQLAGDDADISEAGPRYRFELLPPPGWEITTGNSVQESAFTTVDGGMTGLAAEHPPSVVGLAPAATISGHIPSIGERVKVTATLAGQDAAVTEGPAGAYFQLQAAPGSWVLEFAAGDVSRVRLLELDYASIALGTALTPGAESSAKSDAFVVNFDDAQRSAIEKLAAGYHGLDWDYLLAVDNQFYKGPGYVNGLMSDANVAYNSSGHPVTVKALEPGQRFDFLGGYFSVAWPSAEGETLIARAWRDEHLLAEDRIRLSHLAPVYFQADYRDISRLELSSEHYWQFVVDDMRFRLPSEQAPRKE